MIFAFGGASHSGKTSFIEVLQKYLDDYVVTFDEIIRKKTNKPIDEIRKNPKEYLRLSIDIIKNKIEQENNISINEDKSKIYIFDRSLADSLYYFTFYMDKSQFDMNDWELYSNALNLFLSATEHSFKKIYDYVFLFKPINCENCDDLFRPISLKMNQENEYNLIKIYMNGFSKNIISFDVTSNDSFYNFMSYYFKKCFYIPNIYKEYSELIENRLYPICNVLTNNYGSIEINEYNDYCSWLPLIFSDNKKKTDEIINEIKNIEIESDYMNSRCYPTGYWKEGNIMVIGEAPGVKGRSINGYDLKPSFTFTRTSWFLRNALKDNKNIYITNLLKYAKEKNKVSHYDFQKCETILRKEIELMKPNKIIVLGNNAYDYILKMNIRIPCVKIMHPSGAFYKGINEEEYSNLMMQGIYL